jgi:nitrous oxidase accessory protein NosD
MRLCNPSGTPTQTGATDAWLELALASHFAITRNPLRESIDMSVPIDSRRIPTRELAMLLCALIVAWHAVGLSPACAESLADQLKLAKPGDVVKVPVGVHKVSLNIPSGVTLRGMPGAVIDATGKQDGIHVIGRDGGKQATIDGLEIFGSNYGIQIIKGADKVTVKNCRIHDCGFGVWIRDSSHVEVTDCQIFANRNGVSFYNSGPGSVESSELHHNEIDGILVTFHSHDIRIADNSIHHHTAKAHPDAIQTHNHVERLSIVGNLLSENGQALHSQQTDDVVIKDNVILGTLAQALIIGKGDTTNVEMRNNLIAYTGHIAVNLTASKYQFFDNIVVTGGGKGALNYRGATDVSADRNNYWGTSRQNSTLLLITDKGFYSDFGKYRAQNPIDQNSVSTDPKFPSAPVASSNIDTERLQAVGANIIPVVRSHLFRDDDIIEIGFDGIPRRVRAIANDAVQFDPPLQEKPTHGATVLIWGESMEQWNLGPQHREVVKRLNAER